MKNIVNDFVAKNDAKVFLSSKKEAEREQGTKKLTFTFGFLKMKNTSNFIFLKHHKIFIAHEKLNMAS